MPLGNPQGRGGCSPKGRGRGSPSRLCGRIVTWATVGGIKGSGQPQGGQPWLEKNLAGANMWPLEALSVTTAKALRGSWGDEGVLARGMEGMEGAEGEVIMPTFRHAAGGVWGHRGNR